MLTWPHYRDRGGRRKLIAALYVDLSRGPYGKIPGVDPWDAVRDATRYAGPWPVVAHPPCGPWGRFAWRCTRQDPELAGIAFGQVRRWRGVLEHPAHSRAFRAFGAPHPGELPDRWGGFTIEIDQARYGHECPKLTWLYLVGCQPVDLPEPVTDPGRRIELISSGRRHLTPDRFARWLVALASQAIA